MGKPSELIPFKLVNITGKDIDKATKLHFEMGELKNSISKGRGNIDGFLGEIISSDFFNVKLSNTYNYDFILNEKRIDVKSKKVNSVPRHNYECSVAGLNTKQECDYYIFTRIMGDLKKGWILGYIPKKEYFKKATFLNAGHVDPTNGFRVRSACYNLEIGELNNIEELL